MARHHGISSPVPSAEFRLRSADGYIYPGARHEMLNETCSADVRASLLRWIFRVLQGHESASGAGAVAASQEQRIHT